MPRPVLAVNQILYISALFLSSAGGLVLEIVAGRLIAPYVGMSLYTWTAIIAVVLAGFSAGHWIGGRLAGPTCDERRGARRLTGVFLGAAISTLVCLPLLRPVSGLALSGDVSPVVSVLILTSLLFFLPSLFVGIVAPVLTKLALDARPDKQGPVLGRMYAVGAVGSIAGTLASGYLFISWIGSTGTVIFVGCVFALLALLFGWQSKRTAMAASATAGGMILVFLAGSLADAFTSPCDVESDYYCIRIDDARSLTGRPGAIMALDHLVHSVNDRDDPELIFSPYVHLVDELVRTRSSQFRHGKPGAAYFVGGGAFTLPRAWQAAFPALKQIVAEIDPAVTEAARKAMWFDPGPMTRIAHRDARLALQALPAEPSIDVVFGDAFHDISIPAHLITREFAAEVEKRLNPGGFYAVNIVDIGAHGTPRFLFSFVHTLNMVFPHVEVWIDREEAESPRLTYLVVAGDLPTPEGRIRSKKGYGREWVRWPGRDLSGRIKLAGVDLLTDDFAPVDRLMSSALTADKY